MAASITIADDLLEDLGDEVHNLSSDTIQVALSNTAPASESSNPLTDGNGVLTNVTQVAYTNYSDDLTADRVLESVTWNGTLDAGNFVITASGGALATFQYIYIFNQTATNDPIIACYDHDSAISLADTQSVNVNWNASGIFSNTTP